MSVETELQNIGSIISQLQQGGDLKVGFYNANGLTELQKALKEAFKDIIEGTKVVKQKVIDADKKLKTQTGFVVSLSQKTVQEQEETQKKVAKETAKELSKAYDNATGPLKEILSKRDKVRTLFNDKLARNMFLASKSFEYGLKILSSIFNTTKKYGDIAKDLSDAGLMIGSNSSMLYKTTSGAMKNIESRATDFTNIITYSANQAGLKLEDFAEQLKNNSDLLVRFYSMNIEGTQEIGNLYGTIEKRAKDMSFANANAIVKHWGSTVLPLYSTEEYMADQLNTSFGNLSETMNYFMKATGKSAENLLKENELREKTTALEQLTAENPGLVASMKSVGYSDDMIMNALTGRITSELNLQLMNSPMFASGLRNVQQLIAQHRNDGYLNTKEGRELFANTLLQSVNNARSEKTNLRKMNSYLTFGTYMSYEEIRKRQGVDRLIDNGINPNANVLGQRSSQTEYVENLNDLNKDLNRLANTADEIKSWNLGSASWYSKQLDRIVYGIEKLLPSGASSPVLNRIASGIWTGLGVLGVGYTGYSLLRRGLGLSGKSLLSSSGQTVSQAGMLSKISPAMRTGLKIGGGVLGGLGGGYEAYQGIKNWNKNDSALTQGLSIGQIASGIGAAGALILAPFTGGATLPAAAWLGLGSGLFSMGASMSRSGSELEQSARRGSTEGQPYYFNSPEIVNKLNQIQTVCQSLYGVACANRQMNTFARMDAVSASNK